MPDTFTPIVYANDTTPALNAANLNATQTGIKTIDTRVSKLELGVDAPVTVTYAASLSINAALGSLFRINASGNLTITDITGGTDGQEITVEVLALTADRTLSFTGGTPAATVVPAGSVWSGSFRYRSGTDTWVFTGPGSGSAASYVDEQAQDAAAALFTGGVHSGIIFSYNDAAGRIDATVDAASTGQDVIARAVARAGLVAVDTFTRGDGALGTSESGHAWEIQTGAPAIVGGKVSATAAYVAALDVGRADVEVEATVVPGAGTAPSLLLRVGPTVNDRLALAVDLTNGFRLNKVDGGATTALTTVPQSFTAGTAYRIRFTAVGNTITGYVDGKLLLTFALSDADQAKFGVFTKVGLRQASATVVTFDDLTVRLPYPVGSGVPAGAEYVYPVTGTDADLPTALASAPADAVLVAVPVAGT